MAKKSPIELSSGQVWIGTITARRVVGIVSYGGKSIVVYSTGGDINRICSAVAMRAWVRESGATLADRESVCELVLDGA